MSVISTPASLILGSAQTNGKYTDYGAVPTKNGSDLKKLAHTSPSYFISHHNGTPPAKGIVLTYNAATKTESLTVVNETWLYLIAPQKELFFTNYAITNLHRRVWEMDANDWAVAKAKGNNATIYNEMVALRDTYPHYKWYIASFVPRTTPLVLPSNSTHIISAQVYTESQKAASTIDLARCKWYMPKPGESTILKLSTNAQSTTVPIPKKNVHGYELTTPPLILNTDLTNIKDTRTATDKTVTVG